MAVIYDWSFGAELLITRIRFVFFGFYKFQLIIIIMVQNWASLYRGPNDKVSGKKVEKVKI